MSFAFSTSSRGTLVVVLLSAAGLSASACRLIPSRDGRPSDARSGGQRGEKRNGVTNNRNQGDPDRGNDNRKNGDRGKGKRDDLNGPRASRRDTKAPLKPIAPPFPAAELGRRFFLLPSPFESGASTAKAGRVMLDLFAAPLMDRGLIIADARRLEKVSRGLLKERRTRLRGVFCSAPGDKRRALLRYWRVSARFQLNAWKLTAAHLNAGLDLRLARARKSGALFRSTARSLKLVRRLQQERQELIIRSWFRTFQRLSGRPGAPDSCSRGPAPPSAARNPGDRDPRERLFEPLAAARYEFLRLLPVELRLRMILTFHSPRNSDK